MRKISLSVLALFFQVLSAFSQSDSSAYKERKLRVDEINFVSGYYVQDGNNSAVTGGIGTEKLTNFANTLELKMVKTDKIGRRRELIADVGFDHYTSASSDKIDPSTISSASAADGRFYPSLAYNVTNKEKNLVVGGTAAFSVESDYQSYGIGTNIAKLSKDKNSEVALKLQAYFDIVDVLYPIELRYRSHSGIQLPRNSFSASFTFSQVINHRLQCALMTDLVYQQGLLATKFQRVYFKDNSEEAENLPDQRFKIPIGLRASYFLDDRFIIRMLYRFYTDNWGITGHTASLELPVKISPFVSISPFYRYYTQKGAKYFVPFKEHAPGETFYTSDYDLSTFYSQFYGAGIRFTPQKGIIGITHFAMLEIRYGHYVRNTGLSSDIISLNAQFK
jgi:Protein of unknown function (DUF3570)